jgi:hypothetical protein
MKIYRSTSQIINALGGNRAVAAIFGTTHKAVSNWRVKKFPANTYVVLQSTLLGMDIYAPNWLWAMKTAKRKRRRRIRSNGRMDPTNRKPISSALRRSV